MKERRTDCPDCGGELPEISIIERGHGNHQVDGLRYGLPEARKGFWRLIRPIEGDVISLMCGECGRILLYGAPKEDPTAKHIAALKEEAPAAPADDTFRLPE